MILNTLSLLNDNGELKIISSGIIVTPVGKPTVAYNSVDLEGNPMDEILIFQGITEGDFIINFRSVRVNDTVYDNAIDTKKAIEDFLSQDFSNIEKSETVEGTELTSVEAGTNYTFTEPATSINLEEVPTSDSEINIRFTAGENFVFVIPSATLCTGIPDSWEEDAEYLINIYKGVVYCAKLTPFAADETEVVEEP